MITAFGPSDNAPQPPQQTSWTNFYPGKLPDDNNKFE